MWGPADRIHLGHTADRTGYTGLEHSDCNTAEGARRGNQARQFKPAAAGSDVICRTCRQPYHYAARSCEMCGAHYHPSYGEQRTCGRACGLALSRQNRRARPVGDRVRTDGITVTVPAPWRTSREWLVPAGRTYGKPAASPVYIRECVWCGRSFVGRAADQRACSMDCRRRHNWAKSNAARRVTERTCPCGVTIQPHRRKCDACMAQARREAKLKSHKAECRREGCSRRANRAGRLCSCHYRDALPRGGG
jgi:hypothetical protein